MFTLASSHMGWQADSAKPIFRCDDAARLRALPGFTGQVAVVNGAVRENSVVLADTRIPTDVQAFPGTTAWSPPT